MATEHVFVALGSNLGDRAAHLAAARDAIARLPGTRLVAASAVEETAPLGDAPQPPYLNQMVLLETDLDPRPLLAALQAIEHARGRVARRALGAAHARSRHRRPSAIAASTSRTSSSLTPSFRTATSGCGNSRSLPRA